MANILDYNGLEHFTGKLKEYFINLVKNKVDKVDGKELSTNDLTNALKTNYDAAYIHSNTTHAPSNAEKNSIINIKQNGSVLVPDDTRTVDLGKVLTGGKQTLESSEDGGSNVYTFSDGSTITVKNGSKGSAGATGKNGTNGTSAAWFTGTAVTGTSTSAVSISVSGSKAGDMYLNTSTANVYRASTANSWVYVCNIKGTTGANGVTPTIKAASGANIASVGVPSVTASTSGTTTTFTFNNLKGEKGDAGTNATTTAVASTTANGLMSSTDKINLNTVMSALALATCSTARNATAKVATLANFVLKPGVTIAVKFTNTTTTNPSSGNLTLNVNNTGAKTIAFTRNGAIGTLNYSSAGAFCNNIAHVFTYNGTYWVCITYNADNNTWAAFKGATASANGTAGYIPAPTKGNQDKFFRADGTWATPSTGNGTISYSATEPPVLENNMTWIGSKGD